MTVPTRAAIRRLAIARLISVTGSMAAYTAPIDLVYRRTGGLHAVSVADDPADDRGVGLFEPLGGIVADRVDRKRALIWSDLAGAAAFVLLASVGAPWLLLLVALLTAIVETPSRAGSVAAVPRLLGGDAELAWANGLITMGSNADITLGPALGGLLSRGWGPDPCSC